MRSNRSLYLSFISVCLVSSLSVSAWATTLPLITNEIVRRVSCYDACLPAYSTAYSQCQSGPFPFFCDLAGQGALRTCLETCLLFAPGSN